jgi:hypothetical protein
MGRYVAALGAPGADHGIPGGRCHYRYDLEEHLEVLEEMERGLGACPSNPNREEVVE